MTDQLDAASEAIRQFLHDHPYNRDPARMYYDTGTVREILARLTYVIERIGAAAGQAIRHDSPTHELDALGAYAAADEFVAITALARTAVEQINQAEQLLAELHTRASHLIFPVTAEIS